MADSTGRYKSTREYPKRTPRPGELAPDIDRTPTDGLIEGESYAAPGETAGVTMPPRRTPADVRVSKQEPQTDDERKNGPPPAGTFPENLDDDSLGACNPSGWPWSGSR